MKLPKGFGGQGFGNMMGEMRSAMARAQNLEAELEKEVIESETGPIKVVFDGNGVLHKISFQDKSMLSPDEAEMIEDMIVSAIRAGFQKSVDLRATKTQEIMGNLPDIPGMPKF